MKRAILGNLTATLGLMSLNISLGQNEELRNPDDHPPYPPEKPKRNNWLPSSGNPSIPYIEGKKDRVSKRKLRRMRGKAKGNQHE